MKLTPFNELPEGYEIVTNIYQLYKLRKGKKIHKPENLVRDNAQILYLYSEIQNGFYKRVLTPLTEDLDLKKYIERGALYYKPKV